MILGSSPFSFKGKDALFADSKLANGSETSLSIKSFVGRGTLSNKISTFFALYSRPFDEIISNILPFFVSKLKNLFCDNIFFSLPRYCLIPINK